MAGTRNKNTRGNYCLEQQSNRLSEQWVLYAHSAQGNPMQTQFAGRGLIQGAIPANRLSTNTIDIDSFLKGIGSNDLTKPEPTEPFHPQILAIDSAHLRPEPKIVMPAPWIVEPGQRPFQSSSSSSSWF